MRFKTIAGIGLICGALLAYPAAAQVTDVRSGPNYFKRVLSSTDAVTTSSETFETHATGTVFVPGSSEALVTVRFTSESRCLESGGTSVNWCEIRILVNGTEAAPVETISGQDFAFDITDGGMNGTGSYESHAMDRHLCLRNDVPNALFPVEVQRSVTNLDGGGAPSFWLDDWTVTIEASRGCVVQ